MKTVEDAVQKHVGTNADMAGWKPAPRCAAEHVFIAIGGPFGFAAKTKGLFSDLVQHH